MKKLLDPVSNAKAWGTLSIFGGVISLYKSLNLVTKGTIYSSSSLALTIILALASIVYGHGLRQSKIWGLYSYIIISIISIPYSISIMQKSGNITVNYIFIFGILFNLILSVWFYSAKKRFVK